MKILVIGASHGTGALAVKSGLDAGHDVTAFSRSPQKLVLEHARLTRLPGDFHDPASVAAAVKGHDAVVVTAFPGALKTFKADPTWLSRGTGHAIEAMKTHGVKRLVILSALGVGDSRAVFNFLMGFLLVEVFIKGPYADHERQEQAVKDSGLEWVIARPSRLSDGPARKKYVKTAKIEKVPNAISRADLADFLIEAAATDTWVQKAVSLGG